MSISRVIQAHNVTLLILIRTPNLFHPQQSYRSRRFSGQYTSDIFTTQVDVGTLFFGLAGKSIFSRGLPKVEYLQDAAISKVLAEVTRHGEIEVVVPPAFSAKKIDPTISLAHKNGWLYSEQTKPSRATLRYTFASPLHRQYVEWILFGMPSNGKIKEKKVVDFAIAVIRKFSPLNLETPRPLGTSVQRIPEAQFQDEFYRVCSYHTKNCVASFPEFGTKQGRIDSLSPQRSGVSSFYETASASHHTPNDSRKGNTANG